MQGRLTRLKAAQSLSMLASRVSICSSLTALLATSSTSSLKRQCFVHT